MNAEINPELHAALKGAGFDAVPAFMGRITITKDGTPVKEASNVDELTAWQFVHKNPPADEMPFSKVEGA